MKILLLFLFMILVVAIGMGIYMYLKLNEDPPKLGLSRAQRIYDALSPEDKALYDEVLSDLNESKEQLCTKNQDGSNQPLPGFDKKDADWLDDGNEGKVQRNPGKGCIIGRTLVELKSGGQSFGWCCEVDPDYLIRPGKTDTELMVDMIKELALGVAWDQALESADRTGKWLIDKYGSEVAETAAERELVKKIKDEASEKAAAKLAKLTPEAKQALLEKADEALLTGGENVINVI